MLIRPLPSPPPRCINRQRLTTYHRLDLAIGIITDCPDLGELAPLLVQLTLALQRVSRPDDAPIRIGWARCTISITRVNRERMVAILRAPAFEPPVPQEQITRPLSSGVLAKYEKLSHLIDIHLGIVSDTAVPTDLGALAERFHLAVVHYALLPGNGPRRGDIRATIGLCSVPRARMAHRRSRFPPPRATRGVPPRKPHRRRTPVCGNPFVEALWLDPSDPASSRTLAAALCLTMPAYAEVAR
jgi:hypothetical protein